MVTGDCKILKTQGKIMSQDLILKDMGATLPATKPEYNLMLSNIKDKMPAVTRDTSTSISPTASSCRLR